MKKLSKIIIISIITLLSIGCSNQKEQPKHQYKYTIWTGGSVVNIGYNTDEYKDSSGFIVFISDKSILMIPKEKIAKIEINNYKK